MPVKTPETKEEQDSAYNPGEIHAQEQFGNDYVSKGVDDAEAFANDSANATKNQEEEAGASSGTIPYTQTGRAKQKNGKFTFSLRGGGKKGPIISIILLLLGIGLGGSTFFGPALLLVQMKEVFSNYGGSASRAAPLRYQQRLVYMIGNKKVEKACNKNPASKRCKLGTISDKDRKNYEKNGFKFKNAKDVNGRTVIRKVTFPDGTTVRSGKAFNAYVKKNPAMASRAMSAHNPKTLVFNGGRFARIVLKKFGLNKGKIRLSGDDDKDKKKSFNKHLTADPDEKDSDKKKRIKSKYGDKIEKAGKIRGKGVAALVGLGCAAYNISRVTVAAVKLENSLKFVGFAYLFLKAADQIKDQGSVDPGTIALLGGILTSYATSGPKKGLTATDSQGYKIAAYGGEGELKSFSRNYLLGGSPALKTMDEINRWIKDTFTTHGFNSVKLGCKAIGNIALGTAIGAAVCLGGGGGGGAIAGSVVPVAGTVVGAIVGALGCLATSVIISLGIGLAINKVVEFALPYIINAIKDGPIDADIAGVDAGNAMAVGAGVLLTTTSLSRGMKPADKKDVANFEVATAESERHYDEIARYDARKEPFNIYNQYSFLGSLVRSSGITYSPNTSLVQSLQNMGTILSSAVRVTPSSMALASMPLPINGEDLSHCKEADKDLADIGVDCDRMGQMQLTMSSKELHMSTESNLNYMIGSHVEEDGTPISDDYKNFVKYCTEQREYLMGSDGEPIEDSNDWTSGKQCTEDSTMMSNFRVYYFDDGATEDSDYDTGTNTSVTPGNGSQFRIASFNMRGACHTVSPPEKHCNRNHGYDTRPNRDYKARMEYSYKTIVDNNYDVIGFQEFQTPQINLLKKKLPNFSYSANSKDNSIGWNTDKFEKVSEGLMPNLKYSGNGKLTAPYVKLEDKSTGQQFYVMNTHDPANVFGNAANNRKHDINQHVKFIQKLKNDGVPIFFTGDFNSAYSAKAGSNSYCGITQAKYNDSNVAALSDAYDVFMKREVKCPNKNAKISGHTVSIDRIFVSEGVQVTGMSSVAGGYTSSGSDHPTVAADIIIPSKDGEGEDGISTPGGSVAGDDYAREWSQYKSQGVTGSRECVDFVKFRLVKHGVISRAGTFGNGKDVVGTLKSMGFRTGRVAQVHAVFSTSQTSRPQYGHTGMVSKVNSDGSIVIEEYNFTNDHAYGTRTMTKAQYQAKGYTFAYTGEKYK